MWRRTLFGTIVRSQYGHWRRISHFFMCFSRFKNAREQIEHFARVPELDMVAVVAVPSDCGMGDIGRVLDLFRRFVIFLFRFS